MTRGAPPPVPGGPRRPLFHGGRRRRRLGLRVLLGLVVLVAASGAVYVVLERDTGGGGGGASATPLAVSPPPREEPVDEEPEPTPLLDAEPAPEVPLAGADAFRLKLKRPPRAGLVFDVQTGEVLWRRRPLQRLPIASLTKIMTALVVTERTRPREPVRITPAALHYSGSGVGLLPKGKRVRLETLLNGMMIVSGNDAAIALAVHVSGSERRFVRLMNRHARAWGLSCTRFVDSHGLGRGDRSCAHDLAVMTMLAMKQRRIARIARRYSVSFRFPIKGRRLYLTGHNPLQRMGYRGTIGLKTGYTEAAGRCFVGVARRGGRTLGVVLLNSRDPAKHAPKLLDAGFARALG